MLEVQEGYNNKKGQCSTYFSSTAIMSSKPKAIFLYSVISRIYSYCRNTLKYHDFILRPYRPLLPWCECQCIFCLHARLCVFCLVSCWLCQRCLRLSVCWFVADTAASSPASTWQWNAGNKRCRTTNGCNPKWKSMKKKKKLGPLWSNYIRYCEFKACIAARVGPLQCSLYLQG